MVKYYGHPAGLWQVPSHPAISQSGIHLQKTWSHCMIDTCHTVFIAALLTISHVVEPIKVSNIRCVDKGNTVKMQNKILHIPLKRMKSCVICNRMDKQMESITQSQIKNRSTHCPYCGIQRKKSPSNSIFLWIFNLPSCVSEILSLLFHFE